MYVNNIFSVLKEYIMKFRVLKTELFSADGSWPGTIPVRDVLSMY